MTSSPSHQPIKHWPDITTEPSDRFVTIAEAAAVVDRAWEEMRDTRPQDVIDAEREIDYQLAQIAEAEKMKQPVWVVGVDDDREATWRFDNEEAALAFAHFDSQLAGATAVVVRHDPDGHLAVVATYVR